MEERKTHASTAPNTFRLIQWNINWDKRADGTIFDWDHRKKEILKLLTSLNTSTPTIFALQEVMPEYVSDLNTVFGQTHETFVKQVHPIGRCLYTAFSNKFQVSVMNLPLLKLPNDTVRECWQCFTVRVSKNEIDDNFVFTHAHLPMDAKFRLPLSRHIAVETRKVAAGREINSFIAGDFNTFSDDGGYEQARLIQSAGFYEATSTLLRVTVSVTKDQITPDEPHVRILETFTPYPYDSVPDSPKRYPINLDKLFVSVHEIYSSNPYLEHDIPLCVAIGGTVKHTTKRQSGELTKLYPCSDHFPILTNFTLKK